MDFAVPSKATRPNYNLLSITSMFLTLDLMLEVFVRLPIKSLGQLKLVCKHWNSIISSHDFTKLHEQHTINNNKDNLSITLFNSYRPFSRDHPKLFTFKLGSLEVEQTTEKRNKECAPIGSCDGLICFISRKGFRMLHIWNPATGVYYYFRGPAIPRRSVIMYWGFGYDPLSDDYKILFLGKVTSDSSEEPFARIYALKTSEWKQIECPSRDEISELMAIDGSRIRPMYRAVLMGHTLYWWAGDNVNPSNLLAFDLRNELFEIIPLPHRNSSTTTNLICVKFFVCRFRQSLCSSWVLTDDEFESEKFDMDVWMMDDNKAWKPLFKFSGIEIQLQISSSYILPMLCELREHGKFVICFIDHLWFHVIDPWGEHSPKRVRLNSEFYYDRSRRAIHVLDYNKSPTCVGGSRR